MKKIFLIAAIFMSVLVLSHSTTAHVVINNNYDFSVTREQTFSNNRCSKGYHKLKKILKNEARTYCASQGSHGMTLLRMKKWTKISCVKNRSRNSRTTVTIKGTYSALCD